MKPKNIVIIGSSAGGPVALRDIFLDLPRLQASILLVQHMPQFINESLRQSLDETTNMDVMLATNNLELQEGQVYLAPSERHIRLLNNSRIELFHGEKQNFVCPSIDILMQSLISDSGLRFFGIILTGMGSDGAAGIVHMKNLGAMTMAQNQQSCAVFGMPSEAIATGSIDWVLSPDQIRDRLIAEIGFIRKTL